MWQDGSPEDFVNPFGGDPGCYLLEFAEGERFAVVRYDPNALGCKQPGLVDLEDGAVVTDRPVRYLDIPDPGGHEITPKTIAKELAKTMQCNCDLDKWAPEKDTGHSWVCRIHNAAMRCFQ